MKRFILCSLLAASLPAVAEGPDGKWAADQNGCKVWDYRPLSGDINPDYALYWSGKCVDGYASGEGYLQWIVGKESPGLVAFGFTGTLAKGKMLGYGTILRGIGGLKYIGYFVDSQFEGHGKLLLSSYDSYEGEFSNGHKADGYAVYNWAHGEKYEGQVVDGVPSGHGVYTRQGIRHEGEFKDGVYNDGKVNITISKKHLHWKSEH
jgi:hypothetical protein